MSKVVRLTVLLLLASQPASAAITVTEQIVQTGQFVKANCQPDTKVPDYDACICESDVRSPQISGLVDAAVQSKINDWFKDQVSKTVCEGDKSPLPKKDEKPSDKAHMSISVHYEQTFLSPDIAAFKFTNWAYTGGAHGDGSVTGVIVDLKKGTFLTVGDILSDKNMGAVNDAIYDALSAKPEEEVFRDQVEARKGEFLKEGECQGCTLTLTPEGLHVLFQTYEVAPYGAGNIDVLIPQKLVSNAAIAAALEESKSATPEKK